MSTLDSSTRPGRAHETIPCAFCHGRGVDPFNALSDRSTCGSCSGRGTVLVPTPHVRCAFCSGNGSYKTYRCPACGGAGAVVALDGPTRTCPDCEGLTYVADSGMVCLTCRGRGIVPE